MEIIVAMIFVFDLRTYTVVPNKALLIPDSCGETGRNGNSISSEVKNKYHSNYYLHAICLQLLLSGDISVNPVISTQNHTVAG
jgi:hypothetical protein